MHAGNVTDPMQKFRSLKYWLMREAETANIEIDDEHLRRVAMKLVPYWFNPPTRGEMHVEFNHQTNRVKHVRVWIYRD